MDLDGHNYDTKDVTGQVDFTSHMDAVVTVAVQLVNTLAPGEAHGRRYQPPAGEDLIEAVSAVLRDGLARGEAEQPGEAERGPAGGHPAAGGRSQAHHRHAGQADSHQAEAAARPGRLVTAAEAAAFGPVALALREVFAAHAAGDADGAAHRVNELLARTGARPELRRHDGQAWHLHFPGRTGALVEGWAAGCATGLAVVLGNGVGWRLGICSAPRCDRAYVDTSRNGTRRFCSTACQNRVKAAAFRAKAELPARA